MREHGGIRPIEAGATLARESEAIVARTGSPPQLAMLAPEGTPPPGPKDALAGTLCVHTQAMHADRLVGGAQKRHGPLMPPVGDAQASASDMRANARRFATPRRPPGTDDWSWPILLPGPFSQPGRIRRGGRLHRQGLEQP